MITLPFHCLHDFSLKLNHTSYFNSDWHYWFPWQCTSTQMIQLEVIKVPQYSKTCLGRHPRCHKKVVTSNWWSHSWGMLNIVKPKKGYQKTFIHYMWLHFGALPKQVSVYWNWSKNLLNRPTLRVNSNSRYLTWNLEQTRRSTCPDDHHGLNSHQNLCELLLKDLEFPIVIPAASLDSEVNMENSDPSQGLICTYNFIQLETVLTNATCWCIH